VDISPDVTPVSPSGEFLWGNVKSKAAKGVWGAHGTRYSVFFPRFFFLSSCAPFILFMDVRAVALWERSVPHGLIATEINTRVNTVAVYFPARSGGTHGCSWMWRGTIGSLVFSCHGLWKYSCNTSCNSPSDNNLTEELWDMLQMFTFKDMWRSIWIINNTGIDIQPDIVLWMKERHLDLSCEDTWWQQQPYWINELMADHWKWYVNP